MYILASYRWAWIDKCLIFQEPTLSKIYIKFCFIWSCTCNVFKWDSDPRIKHYKLYLEIVWYVRCPAVQLFWLHVNFEVDLFSNIEQSFFNFRSFSMIKHIGSSKNSCNSKSPRKNILDSIFIIKSALFEGLIAKEIERSTQNSSSVVQSLNSDN